MMRWNQGRADIDRMLQNRELERVPPGREHADRLLRTARQHLASAAGLCDADPDAAYSVMYDGARLALVAILGNQGLRPTSKGGHIATYEAVAAQLIPPMGKVIRPFSGMRQQRNQVEYPPANAPGITPADVREDLPSAAAIVELAAKVLDQMSPY